MMFKQPEVEFIEIDVNHIMTDSCTSAANANPSMQSCSTGSAHEASCASEGEDWVD